MACQYKQENPDLKIIVTGCLAERYKQQIIQEIPEVDAVVGIGSNAALPAIVRRLCADGAGQIESYGPKSDMQLGGVRVISTPRHYAYLKIAEGCNNGCYYCAIPLIRGALRSREINDCVAEARWLAGEGVRELILVAQDPTAYGEDWGRPGAICELLDRLQEIDGIRWVRILYAYPERISDEFIAAMVRNTKVVPYLDLPIQHCDDAVLKAMRRRETKAGLEALFARYGIPYHIRRTEIGPVVFEYRQEKNPCSLCARLRRGALHTAAQELGCNKVALGHHLDDAVETFYMNLWREGRIGCFSPVTQLDRRGLTLIRPMLLATEHEVRCAVKEEDFPIVKSRCPADGVTVREQTKDFVRERCRTDHAFRQKTLHALQESGIDGWRPVHTGRTSNPSPKEGMHHADAEL